jgi:hypothetical protein
LNINKKHWKSGAFLVEQTDDESVIDGSYKRKMRKYEMKDYFYDN